MRILVTGTAGFIGSFVGIRLLKDGHEVAGLDCVNDYYDVGLKEARLARLRTNGKFTEYRIRLEDNDAVETLFREFQPERVVHLAAQAGVRYSLENPHAYVQSNILGFLNILEGCRAHGCSHLLYASSSSVYGLNGRMPFSVKHIAEHPVSLYGASKKANELMAHAFSHVHGLPTTGLRFFTVYGPWGRPDMALFLFTRAILEGRPIDVYNEGRMERDFTYIDDIVEAIVRLIDHIPRESHSWDPRDPDPSFSSAPYRVYNIGNQSPVNLMRFIEVLEDRLGRKAVKNLLPLQPGDVAATCSDVTALYELIDYRPSTPIEVGVSRFVDWYKEYYGLE